MNREEENVRFRKYLRALIGAAPGEISKYATKELRLFLPSFPADVVKDICCHAYKAFSTEPIVLTLQTPIVVVGDIHGHILDLLRIINLYGLPDRTPYLFLGDIVDRGEFSIECILIVFLFKIIWPTRVYMIRGNHEFEMLCSQCGFFRQIVEEYPASNLIDVFMCPFSQIPLAAVVGDSIFCVHGGLGPKVTGVSDLTTLQRPITNFGDEIIDSMLWSDPSDDVSGFVTSNRGTGYLFGEDAVRGFLTANNFKCIVRGHECVSEGCQRKFDGTCITVFSASNYCGLVGNGCAVLEITVDGETVERKFPPLEYLKRTDVQFDRMRNAKKDTGGTMESQSVMMLPKLDDGSSSPESASGYRRSWGCAGQGAFAAQRPKLSKLFARSARKTNPVFTGPPKIQQSSSAMGIFDVYSKR